MRILILSTYILLACIAFSVSLLLSTGWYLEDQVALRELKARGVPPTAASVLGAVAANDTETLALLQSAGVSLNAWDANGDTPLHVAVRANEVKRVAALLELVDHIDPRNKDGFTPLSLALQQNNLPMVKMLLKRTSYADPWVARGLPAMVAAAESGDNERINLLVQHGASASAKSSTGSTALGQALINGHFATAMLLLDLGADPDSRVQTAGQTAMHFLCAMSHDGNCSVNAADREQLVDKLLQKGANPDIADSHGRRPLQLALATQQPGIAIRILERCKNIDDCAWLALTHRNDDAFRSMIERGASIEQRDADGRSLIGEAVREGRASLVTYLLDKGADPNQLTVEGQRLLTVSLARGNPETIAALLKHENGAAAEYDLETPVSEPFLSMVKDDDLTRYLRNDSGITPLMVACALQQQESVNLLLERNANRDAHTRRHKAYPINFACEKSNVPIQQLLLGADPNPETQPRKIVVSLSSQRATFYRNGDVYSTAPVSTGMKGYRTKTGEFTITNKYMSWTSTVYEGASMPFFMRLSCDDFGFHAGSVPGYPVSHGCIRLPYSKAKSWFEAAQVGDRVLIVN